jgi:hypothetical protein
VNPGETWHLREPEPVETFELTEGRSCGSCRACCKVMGIYETSKPRGEWCPHACAKGCAIYETRYQSCRDFRCLWLLGVGADEDRPDRSRVVLSLPSEGGTRARRPDKPDGPVYLVIAAHELAPGTAETAKGERAIAAVVEHGWAVIVNGAKEARRMIYPGGVYMEFPPGHPNAQLDNDGARHYRA